MKDQVSQMEMEHYVRFQELILAEVTPLAMSLLRDGKVNITENLTETLFVEPESHKLKFPRLRGRNFIDLVFASYGEIAETINCLGDCLIYVRRFPFGDTEVARTRYLKFVLEGYFSQVYILKERLVAFAKVVKRNLGRTKKSVNSEKLDGLVQFVLKELKAYTDDRSKHIHESRLSSADIKNMETMELLSLPYSKDIEFTRFMKNLLVLQFRQSKKNWRKVMVKQNVILKKMINEYFKIINEVVFEDGKFVGA